MFYSLVLSSNVLQSDLSPDYGTVALVWLPTLFLLLVVFWLVGKSARVVRPTERGLVERYGRYHKFVNPGLTFLAPFIDRLVRVNITERMSQVQPQQVITKDKVVLNVDAVVFFKVRPEEQWVKASEYNVNNFEAQIEMLARTTLRNIIGTMDMSEANVGREKINAELKDQLSQQSKDWGIEIMRAELKDLQPPPDIQESMNNVIKADNLRLAAQNQANARELEADGFKRAAIKNAEGKQQAAILEAEGQRQATIKIAEGDAEATKLRNEALTTYFKDTAVTFKELDTIATSLKDNAKIIVPQGNTISLILSELEHTRQILPLPPTNNATTNDPTKDTKNQHMK
jgi:regulator of protease activity HflC (stomatin/prohibitin superfamily)